MASLADESALLGELEALTASGRYRALLERISKLPAAAVRERTRIALLASEAYGRLGSFAEAEYWAQQAYELARARGERHAELRARNHQAAIALAQGKLEDAEQHFSAVLSMAPTVHDDASEARALNNLGIIAFLRGDPGAAVVSYQLALAAYQRAGVPRGVVETHHNIGISRCALGDLSGALQAADQAVRLAVLLEDSTLVGMVLTGRADIRLTMGDVPLAEAELRAAEQAYEHVQFRSGLPEVWRVQARAARARGDLTKALDRLREAAALAAVQGSAEVLSATERDLGAALAAAGDDAGAREARARARALYEKLGAKNEVAALTSLLQD